MFPLRSVAVALTFSPVRLLEKMKFPLTSATENPSYTAPCPFVSEKMSTMQDGQVVPLTEDAVTELSSGAAKLSFARASSLILLEVPLNRFPRSVLKLDALRVIPASDLLTLFIIIKVWEAPHPQGCLSGCR